MAEQLDYPFARERIEQQARGNVNAMILWTGRLRRPWGFGLEL